MRYLYICLINPYANQAFFFSYLTMERLLQHLKEFINNRQIKLCLVPLNRSCHHLEHLFLYYINQYNHHQVLQTTSNTCAAHQAQEEKIMIWIDIICTFARVIGGPATEFRNSFSSRSSKKVALHWLKGWRKEILWVLQQLPSFRYE